MEGAHGTRSVTVAIFPTWGFATKQALHELSLAHLDHWRPLMMPDRHRESLSVLSEIRSQSPDVRLGQHLDVFGFMDEVHVNCGLATIDDNELLAVICCHRT